jgi:hypothetical protein
MVYSLWRPLIVYGAFGCWLGGVIVIIILALECCSSSSSKALMVLLQAPLLVASEC